MLDLQPATRRSARSTRRFGLALAGGGPLGAFYEVGTLHAISESLEGIDLTSFDMYVGVSSGAMIAAGLVNGIDTADMGLVFIHNASREYPVRPGLFLRPAFREYLRRSIQVPRVLLDSVLTYLKDPLNHGFLESLAGMTRLIPTAVFDNEPIERFMADLFSNRNMTNDFRKLVHKLLIVAVDLDTGEAVRFGSEGHDDVPISRAVQASTALPGLYPPVRIKDRYFVDGGLKRTLHASAALDEGVDLVFCVNPIVPYDASAAPPGREKRHDSLVEGGLPVVLSQTFRALIHSRMKVGMAKYDTQYVDKDVILFEPDTGDSRMFFANVFSYANRELVCQHAYRTTRRDLWERRNQLTSVLARHGLKIRESVLRDAKRHFTEALDRNPDPERLGLYKNPVTNRLDEVLAQLEAVVRR